MTEQDLFDNLREVEERIERACIRSGRKREDVTLIAVSKTKPLAMLQTVYQAGIREFGENKVQELCEKAENLNSDIHWHMIGHLQRNKVRQVIQKACLIHSVDSLRLAEQIELEASKCDRIVPILIEVNVAGEETKYGVSVLEAPELIQKISDFAHIRVKGLMTSAPYVSNSEENREYFKNLYQLCIDIQKKNIDNVDMEILSMGMTNDYEVAIEEGATHIRVGTGVFGERFYQVKKEDEANV